MGVSIFRPISFVWVYSESGGDKERQEIEKRREGGTESDEIE